MKITVAVFAINFSQICQLFLESFWLSKDQRNIWVKFFLTKVHLMGVCLCMEHAKNGIFHVVLQAENSALMLANENQREAYERCLDEVSSC